MIRMILGRNLEALRDRKYKELRGPTARNEEIAKAVGISAEQVRRICNGDVGTSIDTLEWLAAVFDVRPHDLLTPYFALGDKPPPSKPHSPADEADIQRREAKAHQLGPR